MVGKPKSCTACRQAKMACDARNKAPDPCARCSSKHLECRFDKHFKRIPTRPITRHIANELRIVRPSQNPPEGSTPSAAEDNSQTPATQASGQESVYSVFLLSTGVEGFLDLSLGSLTISSQVIVELLQHFERYYVVHIPFLQPVQSLSRFVLESPLLFWTIVLIATQHHAIHSDLYQQLFLPHRELLAPLSNTAVQSIEDIHALLLLCLWPIPKRRSLLDPAWSYVGIAVNSCMRMNFHSPLLQGHNPQGWKDWKPSSENYSLQAQHLTWLACFNIGTSVATFLGFVPPLSSYHQRKYVRKAIDQLDRRLSLEHRASLAIHEIICNYSISLEDVEDPATHFSLTLIFDESINTVKQTYSAHWTPELDILLQYAKLNLYAMTVLLQSQEVSGIDTQNLVTRQTLLLRGLESASSLIEQMKSISLSPVAEEQYNAGKLTFCPKYFFTSLFFATVFLFRMFANNCSASQAHRAHAIQGMIEAHKLYQLIPHHRDMARARRLVERLLNKARTETASPNFLLSTEFVITNRLGASLLWDTLFCMRVGATGNPLRSGEREQAQECNTLAEIMPPRLPLAPEMGARMLDPTQGEGATYWPSWDASINDFEFEADWQIFS